jgi:hypothetical protein
VQNEEDEAFICGTLDENRARALATIGNSILKGFELTDVRKQLAEIERILTPLPFGCQEPAQQRQQVKLGNKEN